MIRSIVLKNYMSHRHTTIELAEGLTVIVGPNNCGKSALVSALQCLVRAPRGRYMMRHGAPLTSVTVETAEGDVLTWRRSKRRASWSLNGRRTTRVVPDGWDAALRLPEVVLGEGRGRTFDIHVGEQKQPIFLLDAPPGDAAAFFASNSDAALLMEMQRLHRGRTLGHKRDVVRLSAEEAALGCQLDALSPLDDIGPRLDALSREYSDLQRLADDIQALSALCDELSAHEEAFCESDALVKALESLEPPPEAQPTEELASLVMSWSSVAPGFTLSSGRCDALSALTPPPSQAPVAALEPLVHKLAARYVAYQHARSRQEALATLTRPPKLEDTASLERLVPRLADATRRRSLVQATVGPLRALERPPSLGSPEPLSRLVRQLGAAFIEHRRCVRCVAPLEALRPLPSLPSPDKLTNLIDELRLAMLTAQRALGAERVLTTLGAPPVLDNVETGLQLHRSLAEVLGEHTRQVLRAEAFERLTPPPAPEPLGGLEATLDALRFAEGEALGDGEGEALATLKQLPELADVEALEALLVELGRASDEATWLTRRDVELNALEPPPEAAGEGAELERFIALVGDLEQRAAQARRRAALFEGLLEPEPGGEAPDALEALLAAMAQAASTLSESHSQFVAAHDALHAHEAAMGAWAEEHPTCPTCGAPVAVARWLDEVDHEHP